MALRDGDKTNFGTLKQAAADGQLALLDCRRKADGAKVALICAVNFDGEEYEMVPLAVMIEGNPYKLFDPPVPGEGDKYEGD